jgi:uncharacterized sulfatase
MAMAGTASMLDAGATPALLKGLADADSGVRYWAAMGMLMRGTAAPALRKALADASPSVRIAAAEALGRYGGVADLAPALETLIELANLTKNRQWVALAALNAIDSLGAKAAPLAARLKALPTQRADTPKRLAEYVPRLLEDILARFGAF